MLIFNKLKEKFLNLSNSYIFYKTQYISILNQNKQYKDCINQLNAELSKKEDMIQSEYNFLLNQNKINLINDELNNMKDALNNLKNTNHLIIENQTNFKLHYGEYNKMILDQFSYYGKILNSYDEFKHDNNIIKNQINAVNDNMIQNFNNIDKYLFKFNVEYDKYFNQLRKFFFNGYEPILKERVDTDLLFNVCFFNNIKFISYSPNENRILLKNEDGILFSTNNHFWALAEIEGLNEYIIPQLYLFDNFVVFDIGMNRAYASLKFANFENCSAVYGFEIDDFTYNCALENISLNPNLSKKIFSFNFGLSDKDEFVDLYYLEGYDGLNTMVEDFTKVHNLFKNNKENLKSKKVEVKNSTNVISDILEKNNINANLVLKIDTEGAEYKILKNLIDSNLINRFDVILGEGHIFSDDDFKNNLHDLGFRVIKLDLESYTYSFAFVKEKYFKFWPKGEF